MNKILKFFQYPFYANIAITYAALSILSWGSLSHHMYFYSLGANLIIFSSAIMPITFLLWIIWFITPGKLN